MLIDTSVLISLFRDKTGFVSTELQDVLGGRDYVLTRFTQMELLKGSRDETEWTKLSDYLQGQDYLEMEGNAWLNAARIYFDLRCEGLSVRSVVDCCIAELALRYDIPLIHNDRDFDTIAKVRPLKHILFDHVPLPAFHEPDQSSIS